MNAAQLESTLNDSLKGTRLIVVANREPVDVDADSHAIRSDPLADDGWPVQFLRTPIVAEIAECVEAGYKEKAGTAKRPGPEEQVRLPPSR